MEKGYVVDCAGTPMAFRVENGVVVSHRPAIGAEWEEMPSLPLLAEGASVDARPTEDSEIVSVLMAAMDTERFVGELRRAAVAREAAIAWRVHVTHAEFVRVLRYTVAAFGVSHLPAHLQRWSVRFAPVGSEPDRSERLLAADMSAVVGDVFGASRR